MKHKQLDQLTITSDVMPRSPWQRNFVLQARKGGAPHVPSFIIARYVAARALHGLRRNAPLALLMLMLFVPHASAQRKGKFGKGFAEPQLASVQDQTPAPTPTPTPAQTGVSVGGTIVDPDSAAIPAAKVTLTNKATAASVKATADVAGQFSFANVAAGDYVVRAEAKNFSAREQAIKVGTQSLNALQLKLDLATKTDEVTVSSSSKEEELNVSTDRNADRLNFDDNLLRNLPAAGQNPLAVIGNFLSPAAQGGEGLNITIDGAEAGSLNLPGGAVRRIRINRNPYAAEFRRPGKARVEVLTEEGSFRRYRGSLAFYARNAIFDARNTFATTKPDFNRRVFEANVGGPLLNKNTSFFVSGERFLNDESAIINAHTSSGAVNANLPSPERRTTLLGRVEWRAGKAHTVLALYSLIDQNERNRGVGGLRLAEQAYDSSQRAQRFQISDKMILSDHLVNDLRFVFTRETRRAGVLAALPAFIVQGAFTGGVQQTFRRGAETALRIQDVASYLRGKHSVKFGGEFRPAWYEVTEGSNFGGTFEFASLNDYLAQRAFVYRVNRGQPQVKFNQPEAAAFAQDEIKLRPNLSVTAGVRYQTQGNLNDRNNVAPRLSFAYALGDQKTVIRGGAGVFYERVSEEVRRRTLLLNGSQLLEYVVINPFFANPLGNNPQASPLSVVLAEANLRAPRVTQASLSVERELRKGTNVTVEYMTLRGKRLLRSRNINAPVNGKRPDAKLLNANQVESSGKSCTNALSVTVRGGWKRVSGMAQYTLAHSKDDTSGLFNLPANNYELLSEWARSDYDQRHRFNLAGTIELPDGWRLGLIASFASGVPYNIVTGRDDNSDSIANDRPAGTTRNTGIGPGFAQVDLRLSKSFRVPRLLDRKRESSSRNLEFSLDVFNLFNRVNYQNFIGVQTSPFFGRANAARTARSIQLATKYKF